MIILLYIVSREDVGIMRIAFAIIFVLTEPKWNSVVAAVVYCTICYECYDAPFAIVNPI